MRYTQCKWVHVDYYKTSGKINNYKVSTNTQLLFSRRNEGKQNDVMACTLILRTEILWCHAMFVFLCNSIMLWSSFIFQMCDHSQTMSFLTLVQKQLLLTLLTAQCKKTCEKKMVIRLCPDFISLSLMLHFDNQREIIF